MKQSLIQRWVRIFSSTVFIRFAVSCGIALIVPLAGLLLSAESRWAAPLTLFLFFGVVLLHAARAFSPLLQLADVERVRPSPQTGLPSDQPLLQEDVADSEWGDLESLIHRLQEDSGLKAEQLRQERARWRAVLDSIEDALVIVDGEGRPRFWNRHFDAWFAGSRLGVPDSGDLHAVAGVRELFRNPALLGALEEVRMHARPLRVDLDLHLPGDTREHGFRVDLVPARRGDPGLQGISDYLLVIFHDVSDLKRAERMRIDFVANVSHELRTPLTSIRGYAETLDEEVRAGRTDMLARCVEVILRNVDRLGALVQDLLDLSQLESARERELEFEWVEVEPLTRRVISTLESQRARGHYQVDLEVGVPGLTADPRRIEQVLVNLLGNAFKYVPAGGRISVRWSALESPSGVMLEVVDDGPGIPEAHLPRLFERFYRVDPDRSRSTGGTGLGLAIVKHITQAHGGEASVRSQPGLGTTFTCRFPAREVR